MDVGESGEDWSLITHSLFINYTLQLVPIVILYYDYFLALSDEIANYWPPRRPITWLSGVFLATRYLALFGYVPVFVSMIWGFESANFHFFLEVALQVPVGYLCALRVYALYSKDRRVLTGVVVFGLACLVVAGYLASSLHDQVPNFYWSVTPLCATARSTFDGHRLALAWSALLLYDILIFLLTATRAFQVWTAGRIVQVVLRDGVMYFCALAAVNLVNIVTLLTATPLLKTTFASLTNVLSVVLISRLMLNIRSDATPEAITEDTELSTTRFDLDSVIVTQPEEPQCINRPRERFARERTVRFEDAIFASSSSTDPIDNDSRHGIA
ncbi:unnamed protein product [Peniophora sp. CBMAI 1063]|nr:unnamed protein product [Peniophora sp. CBMAI 1063]